MTRDRRNPPDRKRSRTRVRSGPGTGAARAPEAPPNGDLAPSSKAALQAWIDVIRGRPEAPAEGTGLDDPTRAHPDQWRLFALAEAEARHALALITLREFEAGAAPPTPRLLREEALLARLEDPAAPDAPEDRAEQIAACRARIAAETCPGGPRHRLLQRYLSEARARRDAVVADWRAGLESEDEP